jgi:N-acetylmuramoyl-L-alanine amidase
MNFVTAAWLLLALVVPVSARSVAEKKQWARTQFEEAERQRDQLNKRPAEQRSRRDYQQVADAYRQVYYTAPTSSKADSSANAAAEVLAESGHQFQDAKISHAAIGQYEYLRREYPGSKYRVDALFAIGRIYRDDLNDPDQAKATFEEFVKRYKATPLTEQARAALKELEHPGNVPRPTSNVSHKPAPAAADPKPEKVSEAVAAPSPEAAAKPAEDGHTTAVKSSVLPLVTGIRHWSTPDYTRVAIDLETVVEYQAGRVPNPDRIFFDLRGTKLAPSLIGKTFEVQDGFLRKIRVAQYQKDMTRVVLEVDEISEYSAFLLPNPYRLIIDIHGRANAHRTTVQAKSEPSAVQPKTSPVAGKVEAAAGKTHTNTAHAAESAAPATHSTRVADGTTSPLKSEPPVIPAATTATAGERTPAVPPTVTAAAPPAEKQPQAPVTSATTETAAASVPAPAPTPTATSASPAVAEAKPASEPVKAPADTASLARMDPPDLKTSEPTTGPTFESVTPRATLPRAKRTPTPDIRAAQPTADGERSLTRALGLKIGKIVVDAGHGGHDTGTIGPGGLQEKDITLDVALRLGKLLQTKLGADVVYTRDNDTFIPLETRTAIANQNQADLFISIHANSSDDASARGVETYYLNFTSSPDALEVAARENAVSEKSIHELQDLVKKIALKEKIEESREFASDVQRSMWAGESAKSPAVKNRGVRKAPFIVLIGANMPSILAEISFLSNPTDERKLNTPEYRQKIAEYLYRGIARYINGLSGVKVAQSHPVAAR